MMVYCEAIVENPQQKEHLCELVEALGGKPITKQDKVEMEFDGESSDGEQFVRLFEQYSRHTILTIVQRR